MTRDKKLGFDTLSKTAIAAAHTRGPPANVLPWSPLLMAAFTRSVTSVAPIGRPPARGLARVIMSGVTSYAS